MPVYVEPELGLVCLGEDDLASNGATLLVACPWREEEDEARFKPLFETLEKDAKKEVERQDARENRQPA